MSKLKCVVSCPIDTYSGYGGRSRDFVKALIRNYPDWDIKLLSQRWGVTRFGYLKDHKEIDLRSRIISKLDFKPDIWFQITIPNEFQPVGKFNVGVTAAIETTICHESWIEGVNRMDLTLASSDHSAKTLTETQYEVKHKQTNEVHKVLKTEKPVEVLFEGVDTTIFNKIDPKDNTFDLSFIKENFCFLTVGHWMKGDFGHDRKNIAYTIKVFLEVFKNKNNPPALILKTQTANSSLPDRRKILEKINSIRKSVRGVLPNIYLLHGDLSEKELNNLYNNPKVKALLSLTKGEGFGRPLLEFTTTGKPVIASKWSGHLDFLNEEFTQLIPGELEQVHSSAAQKDIIMKESKWFKPSDPAVGKVLKEIFKTSKSYLTFSRKQRRYTLDNFTFEHMVTKQKDLLDSYLPEFPTQVEAKLPKLSLPKLKKISK